MVRWGIVEDNSIGVQFLKDKLTLHFSDRPDLIFLDIHLPDGDGFDVFQGEGRVAGSSPLSATMLQS